MCVKSDEQILYECYIKLSVETENKAKNKKNVSAASDRKLINGINSKLSLLLVYLEEINMLSMDELLRNVIKAKGIYVQFFMIKGRNHHLITASMNNRMDRLIHAVARHEANTLLSIRTQETGGERINLEIVFEEKSNINRLGNILARDIVKNAIKDLSVKVGKSNTVYYITESGKKYHTENCPYCRGRELLPTTRTIVENLKLTACKCISMNKATDEVEKNFVTAFIDESIHPIWWNEEGKRGRAGSYSYVICRGHLASEKDIENTVIIAQGIDYLKEKKHVEHLTEAAIGKVMMKLAYDYEFAGNVQIYTDNISAMEKWPKVSTNSRLSKLFESVSVSFVPREKNTYADMLGRKQMFMSIPTDTYNDIVAKVRAYDKIQKQKTEARCIEELKEEPKIKKMSMCEKVITICKKMFKIKKPLSLSATEIYQMWRLAAPKVCLPSDINKEIDNISPSNAEG